MQLAPTVTVTYARLPRVTLAEAITSKTLTESVRVSYVANCLHIVGTTA